MELIKLKAKTPNPFKIDITDYEGCWIAGGSVRDWYFGEEINDVDVFFADERCFNDFVIPLAANSEFMYRSKFTYTCKYQGIKVQCVKLFDKTLEKTFARFDFTVCQFCYDGKDIYTTEQALVDHFNSKLTVNYHQWGGGWWKLWRVAKYVMKGYSPDKTILPELCNAFKSY